MPTTAEILSKNIEINNFNSKSEVHVKAISDNNGRHKININLEHSGSASIDQAIGKNDSLETIDVTYLNRLDIPKDMDIVIKIDVEGHEKIVVEQLIQTFFLHSVSAIYYEYDTKIQDDMDTIKELLKQNNFTIFSEVKDEGVKNVFNMLSTKDIN